MNTRCGMAVVALLLALALRPAGVLAAGDPSNPDGHDLLQVCTDGLRTMDEVQTWDFQPQDQHGMLSVAQCAYYLLGFVEAFRASPHLSDPCFPQRLSAEEVMRAVAQWLRAHPAVLAWSRRDAARAALYGVYPCPAA